MTANPGFARQPRMRTFFRVGVGCLQAGFGGAAARFCDACRTALA
jgi:hypothetical protein